MGLRKQQPPDSTANPDQTICERVLRYLRLAGFGRGGCRIRIRSSTDYGTHWGIGFAVASLEDPSRDFLHASIVVEKATGDIYAYPSRSLQPIDHTDIASIRRGCTRITVNDIDQMASRARLRPTGPCCRWCYSHNIRCDGGMEFVRSDQGERFIRWLHACDDCGRTSDEWSTPDRGGSGRRCPHIPCESVWQGG